MKDGYYWLNDRTRYGWEVVCVKNQIVKRIGTDFEEPISLELNLMDRIEIKQPSPSWPFLK